MKFCVLDSTGVCVNVIEADKADNGFLPSGTEYAPDSAGEIGWTFSDGVWSVPEILESLSKDEVSEQVRDVRNRLLLETDWTALSDNVMTPEMATYRQALRDITAQEGFPYSVTWPTKP
jgi:hypothetical protein